VGARLAPPNPIPRLVHVPPSPRRGDACHPPVAAVATAADDVQRDGGGRAAPADDGGAAGNTPADAPVDANAGKTGR